MSVVADRATATLVILSVAFTVLGFLSADEADASWKRGTCTLSMWREGERISPIGPENCADTYGGSKYTYAAYHYYAYDTYYLEVTQLDFMFCINCLGGAASTWPTWYHGWTKIDGNTMLGSFGEYSEEWKDVRAVVVNYLAPKGSSAQTQMCNNGNQWHGSFCAWGPKRYLDFT